MYAIEHFEALTEQEVHLLMDAPALITILIGAADGNLDREERTWSEKMLKARTYGKPKLLHAYNVHVAEQFWAGMNGFLHELPDDVTTRSSLIEGQLSGINAIMEKLSPEVAGNLYAGFLRLAGETARASGGFLRFGAIGEAEARWVDLPMIRPVPVPKGMEWEDESETEEDDEAATR
jgi:hypothetical protein